MYPNQSLIYDLKTIYDKSFETQKLSPEEIHIFLSSAYVTLSRAAKMIEDFEQRLREERAQAPVKLELFKPYNL
jgi:hypothetical protein